MTTKTIDAYVEGLADWRGDTIQRLREVVRTAVPNVTEAFKWSQPVFESDGPVAYAKAHAKHVNFGFWRGAELDDPNGVLEGSGQKMRHVKLMSVDDIDDLPLSVQVKRYHTLADEMRTGYRAQGLDPENLSGMDAAIAELAAQQEAAKNAAGGKSEKRYY